ncbi:caspase family protein [Actinokineospora globicatena]|uniref:Peptidase C14 caspase domain-containing protein n=1 Tax=Actinokineospora globicatena TaxID=103729 RepID=A0A9W6V954_9PSEU|nr:caspase family protein [Actinokineospora globicatena]GLW90681.1 hypothetical protein Aglo03_14970 [Actinokineospora globicatena]
MRTGVPDRETSRVVLAGACRFRHLPDLPAVRNNVGDLRDCLSDPTIWGLAARNITTVTETVSAAGLVDAVHAAAAEAEDTLVFYYSGHGMVDPHDGELGLALVESVLGRPHTAVRYHYVRQAMVDSPARRKVVVLDCCFSGRAIGAMGDLVTEQLGVAGTYVLASAPSNAAALAPPGARLTAFTGELVTLLRNGVPDGPRTLDLDLVYRHLRQGLVARSFPEPQRCHRNSVGELPLFHNRAWRPPAQSIPSAQPDPPVRAPRAAAVARLVADAYALRQPAPDRVERVIADVAQPARSASGFNVLDLIGGTPTRTEILDALLAVVERGGDEWYQVSLRLAELADDVVSMRLIADEPSAPAVLRMAALSRIHTSGSAGGDSFSDLVDLVVTHPNSAAVAVEGLVVTDARERVALLEAFLRSPEPVTIGVAGVGDSLNIFVYQGWVDLVVQSWARKVVGRQARRAMKAIGFTCRGSFSTDLQDRLHLGHDPAAVEVASKVESTLALFGVQDGTRWEFCRPFDEQVILLD